MANEIALQKVLEEYGTALEAYLPILELANTDIGDKFGDDQGDTIYAKIRNVGTVYKTDDLTNKMSDIKTDGVPLKLDQYKMGLSLSFIEDTLEAGGDIDAILKDNAAAFADSLGVGFYETALLGSATTHVSTGTYADLSLLGTHVKKAAMSGSVGGMLSFDVHNKVINSGSNHSFNAAPAFAKNFYQGVIGEFGRVNYLEGRTDLIETGAIFAAGSVTVTAGVAHYTPAASVSTAFTVKKGTVFTLAGVYSIDMFGKSTGVLRSFIVQEDVEVPTGAGGVDINIGEVIFSGARKNVSVSAISAVALTNKLEANARYATGVVFAKNELMIGMKGIRPIRSGFSSSLMNTSSVPLRLTYDGSAKTSTNDLIFDVLAGSSVYARRASSALYVKIS